MMELSRGAIADVENILDTKLASKLVFFSDRSKVISGIIPVTSSALYKY